jgi:hypothetical protein
VEGASIEPARTCGVEGVLVPGLAEALAFPRFLEMIAIWASSAALFFSAAQSTLYFLARRLVVLPDQVYHDAALCSLLCTLVKRFDVRRCLCPATFSPVPLPLRNRLKES